VSNKNIGKIKSPVDTIVNGGENEQRNCSSRVADNPKCFGLIPHIGGINELEFGYSQLSEIAGESLKEVRKW